MSYGIKLREKKYRFGFGVVRLGLLIFSLMYIPVNSNGQFFLNFTDSIYKQSLTLENTTIDSVKRQFVSKAYGDFNLLAYHNPITIDTTLFIRNSVFKSPTIFSDIKFNKSCTFINVTFTGEVHFTRSKFTGHQMLNFY